MISQLKLQASVDKEEQFNHESNSTTVQPVEGGSGDTSPSLLENSGPHSTITPNRNKSKIDDHKWTKRKRKKRLKQITLTQHQNVKRKCLSLRKTDQSINVIPQSPLIDLSTLQSDSSLEDNQPNLETASGDMDVSNEYGSSSDDAMSNQNASSQNCDMINHACDQSHKTFLDNTFVPDTTSQRSTIRSQDFATDQRDNTTNLDHTFVHNIASQQVCDLTNQDSDDSITHDHTYSQATVNQYHDSNEELPNSTNQNHNTTNQNLDVQR